jgi:Cu/Ag efflux pump CusA
MFELHLPMKITAPFVRHCLYVNDFNRFGRVYQVRAQADAPFRANPEDILQLKTRNSAGQMVPLSSLVNVTQTYGPEMVVRYNGYTNIFRICTERRIGLCTNLINTSKAVKVVNVLRT